ncbi:21969_t:CDS:2 [Gigaspora rosea]|nr:21969_t:CDS:2 [Gigaspora rosea]
MQKKRGRPAKVSKDNECEISFHTNNETEIDKRKLKYEPIRNSQNALVKAKVAEPIRNPSRPSKVALSIRDNIREISPQANEVISENEEASTSYRDMLQLLHNNDDDDYKDTMSANSILSEGHSDIEDLPEIDIEELPNNEKLLDNQQVEQIPLEFDQMDNVLEVCNWLIKHPHILRLAN